MASKKSLLGGVTLKVESMSGFDKSRYNAFTAPLGSIVPMVKQLCLPGKVKCSIKLSAQLPPLASDSFLRTHLKAEAFFIPLRLCYGGFQSFLSGEPIVNHGAPAPSLSLTRAQMPFLRVYGSFDYSDGTHQVSSQLLLNEVFGVHTLMDYFGVHHQLTNGNVLVPWADPQIQGYLNYSDYNIMPFVAYQLCYHHWYRNKMIERPLFAPPAQMNAGTDLGRAVFLLISLSLL